MFWIPALCCLDFTQLCYAAGGEELEVRSKGRAQTGHCGAVRCAEGLAEKIKLVRRALESVQHGTIVAVECASGPTVLVGGASVRKNGGFVTRR